MIVTITPLVAVLLGTNLITLLIAYKLKVSDISMYAMYKETDRENDRLMNKILDLDEQLEAMPPVIPCQ